MTKYFLIPTLLLLLTACDQAGFSGFGFGGGADPTGCDNPVACTASAGAVAELNGMIGPVAPGIDLLQVQQDRETIVADIRVPLTQSDLTTLGEPAFRAQAENASRVAICRSVDANVLFGAGVLLRVRPQGTDGTQFPEFTLNSCSANV
ncbi:hypothetical protein [Pelagovum pacificum]|uniref:Lipoprotein n=1 Tax=Pelagovum pacificum TaxID=2588711 RepID=A0A5C5GGB3_9RHOB|nr:hypothetical protein [Pelagovum pacificum]QQA43784.1 hypothetical protein I8N54_04190 [Pelagovum pacificum]TNY33087.1 hypothetical protein FHY64_07345 [Pelagovum pacificum]